MKEMLQKFFSGLTNTDENAAIHKWFNESEENRETFYSERKLYDTLTLCIDKDTKDLGEEKTKRQKFFAILKYSAVALSAAIIMLLVMPLAGISNSQLTDETHIEVPIGQKVDITLSDGTAVCLSGGSSLKYGNLSSSERVVSIKGQAFFDVAKDETRPFKIKTDIASVTVFGTKFDIIATDNFEVSLFEGSVELETPTETIMLTPNNRAVLNSEGVIEVNSITDFDTFLWRDGLFSFNQETLEEIIPRLERFYGATIVIDDGVMASKTKLTGKFRNRDGIFYVLSILTDELGLTIYQDFESQSYHIK